MKKYIFAAVLSLGILASPAFTQAAGLTQEQISAIISLLQSFGADQATINNVQTSLNGGTPTGGGTQAWCHRFNTNLKVGDEGVEVAELQEALSEQGFTFSANFGRIENVAGVAGHRYGFYRDETASVVTGFQEKYANDILTPNGLQHGTGYVGASTRAKLNALYGCRSSQSASSSSNNNISQNSPITISPTSGVAGSMVTWNGYYSFCGVNVDPSVCTEDRFNQLVFLQNGTVVSSNIAGYYGSTSHPQSNYEAIQIPTTLSPGVYQLAMQNCLGKGCRNNNLATFTVVAQNQMTAPAIISVSPSSINDLTTMVTIHGSGFTQNDNYISFASAGVDNKNPYYFISKASSSDGNTITFQFPSCYASTPPTCGSFAYGASQFAISNVNGTSNNMPFMLLVQPYRFK